MKTYNKEQIKDLKKLIETTQKALDVRPHDMGLKMFQEQNEELLKKLEGNK